jgi:hypothetical protein
MGVTERREVPDHQQGDKSAAADQAHEACWVQRRLVTLAARAGPGRWHQPPRLPPFPPRPHPPFRPASHGPAPADRGPKSGSRGPKQPNQGNRPTSPAPAVALLRRRNQPHPRRRARAARRPSPRRAWRPAGPTRSSPPAAWFAPPPRPPSPAARRLRATWPRRGAWSRRLDQHGHSLRVGHWRPSHSQRSAQPARHSQLGRCQPGGGQHGDSPRPIRTGPTRSPAPPRTAISLIPVPRAAAVVGPRAQVARTTPPARLCGSGGRSRKVCYHVLAGWVRQSWASIGPTAGPHGIRWREPSGSS